ncbi:hypothetical protein CLAIMM_04290 [Cladophialophora immunda]|nr:hypothetical protein CLAIMM_04290 [Cladophialophora immunda]
MAGNGASQSVFSLLDTDLYKLNMQCAVLKYFASVQVEYFFTNRTPQMRLSRCAAEWLRGQIDQLENVSLTQSELEYLRSHCGYLHEDYLRYLQSFRLRPKEQVHLSWKPVDDDFVDIDIRIKGLWVETILYEIPVLALTSEAYFRFVDRDWSHENQEQLAYEKGTRLLQAGCTVSEFGTRRRRDFKTQDLVVGGLVRSMRDNSGLPGRLAGTSNVYFAMKHRIAPIGTVAHEWYMGIASITSDYEHANELGLKYWLDCFGVGVMGVALTDTFGTPNFFQAFKKPVTPVNGFMNGLHKSSNHSPKPSKEPLYAEVYEGIRQDSGDPIQYVKMAKEFYDSVGAMPRSITFSDSLNVEKCIKYKEVAEQHGFQPSFGVGTFFTNDFQRKSDPSQKSRPLNIVMKLRAAGGRPCIKLSDNVGKTTGDEALVQDVKRRLGYQADSNCVIDESRRW